MRDYLLISSVVSISVLCILPMLRSAPPRLKLWVCLFGIAMWGIPWNLVLLGLQDTPLIIVQYAIPAQSFDELATSIPVLPSSISWFWLLLGLAMLGAMRFVVRCVNQFNTLRLYKKQACPMPEIWRMQGFVDESTEIYILDDFSNAFVSGYFKKRIWLGRSKLNSDAIKSILWHELMHVRGNDNFYLLYIALFRDLFWWNPIVRILAKYARQFIELSCDLRCQALDSNYQTQIARELLNSRESNLQLAMATPFLWQKKFNIYRLSQLDKEFSVKKLHLVPVFIVLSLGLLVSAATVAKNETLLTGSPILLEVDLKMGKTSVFDGTLVANHDHWTGVTSGDYLFRIKLMLLPKENVNDELSIFLESEISKKTAGGYQVIYRPKLIGLLDKSLLVEIREREEGLDLSLAMTPRLP